VYVDCVDISVMLHQLLKHSLADVFLFLAFKLLFVVCVDMYLRVILVYFCAF